ncbi:oligosaccharyltransferase complex subunit gamma [Paragonimus westermani]|uniref:Oligosaccharyltransferase complex subunit gamma n=1 Tax=Paragonimus westermani TaxID=34504 RepID=A0A5J4P1H3_9TREM|nr:oligosaccharyltransferase complex subunit gamma [Paragonimus westermani]
MYVVLSAFLCILGYCYGFQEYSLDVRFRRLSELSLYNSVPKFTSDEFRTFALSKPRNYSLFVFLTALSKHHFTDQLKQVEVCYFYPIRLAEQEFRILADSWKRRSGELFFALADHDRDPEIFQIIRVVRPPSYMGTFLLALFMTIGGAALWFRRVSLSPLLNPSLWCMLSLALIFCGISGQVYNQIRGPPLLHGTPSGEIKAFIYPGSDYQFVAETLIVMMLCILFLHSSY